MALVVKDRVKETTTTTGTGALTLGGADTNFIAFSAALSDGDTTYYALVDDTNDAFEVGLGTYASSGTTLTRTTVLASSNSGSAVNLQAGAKDVFITYPADKSVYLDAAGKIGSFASTGIDDNATSTAITIDSDERVGINITPTNRTFEVKSIADAQIIASFETGSSVSGRIAIADANTTADSSVGIGSTGDNLNLYAGAAAKATLSSAGNLSVTGNLTSLGIDDNATSTVLTVDQNNGLIVDSSGTTTIRATGATHSIVRVMSGDDTSYGTVVFGDTSSNTSGQIQYTHSNDAMVFKTDNTTAVTINSSQNTTFAGAVTATSAVLEGAADNILTMRSTDDGPLYMEFERGTDRHAYLGFGGSNDQFKINNEESGGTIQLLTANTAAVTIDSSQNVLLSGKVLELSNGSKLQVGTSSPQNTDLTGGSTNGTDSDGLFAFYGGRGYNTGAGLVLNGEDHASLPNVIRFVNGAFVTRARINADGTFLFFNGIREQEYSLTGTEINPNNGTIQYKTLSANTTFTKSITNGEFVTLMINDGSNYTVTWPTTTWVGGSAPTLGTSGYNVIHLWQVNGTLYGAFIGTTA